MFNRLINYSATKICGRMNKGAVLSLLVRPLVSVEAYCCTWSHSVTHWHTQTVGLLWAKDRPVTETPLPDNVQQSQETDTHAPGGIRTRNPSNSTSCVAKTSSDVLPHVIAMLDPGFHCPSVLWLEIGIAGEWMSDLTPSTASVSSLLCLANIHNKW